MGLSVKDLYFSYKKNDVLKGVSFDISKGKLLCVLGKNGAGKSTLFRCILGLLKHYEGSILIDGAATDSLSARELSQKIAYIPQNHSTVFPFSVFDMVLMGTTAHLGQFENPGKSQKKAAADALKTMNIGHLKDRSFSNISGGEQQLTLIARAIAQQTKTLIMDEPCSNLDYGNQIRVMKSVKRLAEQGYLVIQSTHNPEHAFLFADEVLVMLDGKVGGIGPSEEILTEELLQKIYGIQIQLHDIEGSRIRVCVPDQREI